MAEAVRARPAAAAALEGGRVELPVTWTDVETGIECKGRLDCITTRFVDLKTTVDASPRAFAASAVKYSTHAQVAYSNDGAVTAGLLPRYAPARRVSEGGHVARARDSDSAVGDSNVTPCLTVAVITF